ncbi:MAG: DUF5010 domain-containing protein [Nanoarchaeota archaeon]
MDKVVLFGVIAVLLLSAAVITNNVFQSNLTGLATGSLNRTCFDSDGGKNYGVKGYVKGTTSNSKYELWDYCQSSVYLAEQYCYKYLRGTKKIACPVGSVCQDGACVKVAICNGICEPGDSVSCPADCAVQPPPSVCGNGICESNETTTCPADCTILPPPSVCGNGVCEPDENVSCVLDCPAPPPINETPPVNDTVPPVINSTQPVSSVFTGTYFYYWYDVYSGAHMDPAGLATSPQSTVDFSYKSVDWFKREFTDMKAAGIDNALMVYWGRRLNWSLTGVENAAIAVQEMDAQGKPYPQIGLFYDTNVLNGYWDVKELISNTSRDSFYRDIYEFYKRVPKKYWATINGRPVIWLWLQYVNDQYNQESFDYMYSRFEQDFGVRPYIVKEEAWWKVNVDLTYRWGASLSGIIPTDLAADHVLVLGAGYNDSILPDRNGGFERDRKDGDFYRRNLEKMLVYNRSIIVFETWNEFHEGSTIARSAQHGDYYIQLTKAYVDALKRGEKKLSSLPCETNSEVKWSYGNENCLLLIQPQNARVTPLQYGKTCIAPAGFTYPRFIYFDIADEFAWATLYKRANVTVEVFDYGNNSISLQYDSTDLSNNIASGAFKYTPWLTKTNSSTWKNFSFFLNDPLFSNRGRDNGELPKGADFRIDVFGEPNICVASVTVKVQ